MYAFERGSSVVEIVGTLAQVEVEDADGIDLLHLVVLVAQLDVFGDRLRYAIEDALQVVEFPRKLYLHDDDVSLGILCLHIDAVEFVVEGILISFALKYFFDVDFLIQKHGDKSLQHAEVRLVAEHTLGCPVEAYILVLCHNSLLFCLILYGKGTTNIVTYQIFSEKGGIKAHKDNYSWQLRVALPSTENVFAALLGQLLMPPGPIAGTAGGSDAACCAPSPTVGKLQSYRGKTPVLPRWYWEDSTESFFFCRRKKDFLPASFPLPSKGRG